MFERADEHESGEDRPDQKIETHAFFIGFINAGEWIHPYRHQG